MKKIDRIITEILTLKITGHPIDIDPYIQNDRLVSELFNQQIERSEIVDKILDRLFALKSENNLPCQDLYHYGSPLYFLTLIIMRLAESRHTERICEILSWPELRSKDSYTNTKHSWLNLFTALREVGRPDCVNLFKSSIGQLIRDNEPARSMALNVVMAMKKRT